MSSTPGSEAISVGSGVLVASVSLDTANCPQTKPEGTLTLGLRAGKIFLGNLSSHPPQGVVSGDSKKQRDFSNREKFPPNSFFPVSFYFFCLSSGII